MAFFKIKQEGFNSTKPEEQYSKQVPTSSQKSKINKGAGAKIKLTDSNKSDDEFESF